MTIRYTLELLEAARIVVANRHSEKLQDTIDWLSEAVDAFEEREIHREEQRQQREEVLSDLAAWLETINPEDDGAEGERYAAWKDAL